MAGLTCHSGRTEPSRKATPLDAGPAGPSGRKMARPLLPLFRRDFRQVRQRGFERLRVVVLVIELAGEIVAVGLHVEMAVAGEVEEDRRRLALLPRLQGLVDRRADRMVRFRGRHDALLAREHDPRLEAWGLVIGAGLDQPQLYQVADQR